MAPVWLWTLRRTVDTFEFGGAKLGSSSILLGVGLRPEAATETACISKREEAKRRHTQRVRISFRKVNARGEAGYDPSLQRHHILPKQLLSKRCFSVLFERIGRQSVGFDDFRHNGLLLPATEEATHRTGMPLHRGPHRRYNELVMERVARIDAQRIEASKTDPEGANSEAVMRLRLL